MSFGAFSCGASLPRPAPWRSEHAETKWSRTEGRNGGDAQPETLRKEVVEENDVRATPSKKPLILLGGSPRRFQLELHINVVSIFLRLVPQTQAPYALGLPSVWCPSRLTGAVSNPGSRRLAGLFIRMCSGPFSGAQDTPIHRRAQSEGATWIGSVAKWRLKPSASA